MRYAIAAWRDDILIGYVALSSAKSGGFRLAACIKSAWQCSESSADRTIMGLYSKRQDLRFEKAAVNEPKPESTS